MESKEDTIIRNAMSVLSEHGGTLLSTDGCMCCLSKPTNALKIVKIPPTPFSLSSDDMAIGFFICKACREGAYDENKTLENLELYLQGMLQ